MCAHLKDCHPNRIDVRVLRGKLFCELASKPEPIGEKQLRRHPPSRAFQSAIGSGSLTSRFINDCGKPEVRQASAALRIYQDVDLAASCSVVTNCAANQELTPFKSPWTTSRSCKYSNLATAPASCPNNQRDTITPLSLHSRDECDCNPGWPG